MLERLCACTLERSIAQAELYYRRARASDEACELLLLFGEVNRPPLPLRAHHRRISSVTAAALVKQSALHAEREVPEIVAGADRKQQEGPKMRKAPKLSLHVQQPNWLALERGMTRRESSTRAFGESSSTSSVPLAAGGWGATDSRMSLRGRGDEAITMDVELTIPVCARGLCGWWWRALLSQEETGGTRSGELEPVERKGEADVDHAGPVEGEVDTGVGAFSGGCAAVLSGDCAQWRLCGGCAAVRSGGCVVLTAALTCAGLIRPRAAGAPRVPS